MSPPSPSLLARRRDISSKTKNMNYRTKYRSMPNLSHSASPEQSEVIQHIMATEGCDATMAVSIWDQIRRPSRRIVVFDRIERTWSGWDLASGDQHQKIAAAQTAKRLKALETRVTCLEDNIERLAAFVNGKAS